MSRICIIFGGKSTEHEISLLSAKNVIDTLATANSHVLVLIGIDKAGCWRHYELDSYIKNSDDANKVCLGKSEQIVSFSPGDKEPFKTPSGSLGKIDCVFPMLHGPNGEDGSPQGLFRLLDLPFVGCDVLGSSVCMDKELCKRVLRDAGIKNAAFITLRKGEPAEGSFENAKQSLGMPMFIKPANLGSSVGITKANTEEEYYSGISEAFQFDEKIIIEEAISGRELECSVLGNEDPVASLPGEVIAEDQFYSYDAKYVSKTAAKTQIPAELPEDVIQDIQTTAIKAFKALECRGMARVDFFLSGKKELLINEINTIPGFTSISMYPKMWETSGLPYPALLEKLIELATESHKERNALKSSY